MPNKRGSARPGDLERAHPFPAGRFAEPEPQSARGDPGSRGIGDSARQPDGDPAGPRRGRDQRRSATEWTGVNPLEPIDPAMPHLKPGDQAG